MLKLTIAYFNVLFYSQTMPYELVPNQGSTPANAAVLGYQHDVGDMILGVARTRYGDIPGKVKDNTCWYPYGGEECITNDFQ